MPKLNAEALAEMRIEAVADIAEAAMGHAVDGGAWAMRALSLMDEIRQWRDERTVIRGERDALWIAVAELVACKDLRDGMDAGLIPLSRQPEYTARKAAAWDAARQALRPKS